MWIGEIIEATDRALAAELPSKESITRWVYSPDVDPTGREFESVPKFSGEPKTMVDIIPPTLADEMERDARIVVFGEDVADCSREDSLSAVKGKGGVFKATAGLQRRFGTARVFNTPLAEANIVGRAVGMALRGMKPVAEIQFFDYIWPAMMQIRDEMVLTRWRSAVGLSTPVVRSARRSAASLTGGGIYHSQSGEGIVCASAGSCVWSCRRPRSMCAVCCAPRSRSEDPVFVPRAQAFATGSRTTGKRRIRGLDFTDSLWQGARGPRRAADVSCRSPTERWCIGPKWPAVELEREGGISLEILDLAIVSPYDWEAIVGSVRKTNRVIVAYEDMLSWGYAGAEIAARLPTSSSHELDASY